MSSPVPAARLKAIEVLGRMGSDAHDAVPQLVTLLDDPDPAVRKAAARTLGLIGPAANAAVPALMRKLLQPPWIWGVLLCVAFTAVHTFYWTNLRMRAPLMPFVALVAAAAVDKSPKLTMR